MCAALVLFISWGLKSMVNVNVKWYEGFEIGLKRFERLKFVVQNKRWLNSKKNGLGLWTQSQKWYILGGNSYTIYPTNCGRKKLRKDVRCDVIWIFLWWVAEFLMCSWFVSIWESPTRGQESRSDVGNNVQLIE